MDRVSSKSREPLSDTDEYTSTSQTLLVTKRRYVLSELRIKRVDKDIICQQASDKCARGTGAHEVARRH